MKLLLKECRERIADAIQGGHDTPLMRQTLAKLDAQFVPASTVDYCPEKLKPGGCQLHNLHCGYPECNKPPALAESRAAGVVVPREPTFDMLEAGAVAYENSGFHDLIGPMNAAYKAMLAASPTSLDSGWIACSERLPTMDDADDNGDVLYWWPGRLTVGFEHIQRIRQSVNADDPIPGAMWKRIPPAPTRAGSEK